MHRRSLGEDLPLEAYRPLPTRLFDVDVDSAGAGETLVARLSTEGREAHDPEGALAPVRSDGAHLRALQRLDRGRFAGLQTKA